jgi:hypothetical protein
VAFEGASAAATAETDEVYYGFATWEENSMTHKIRSVLSILTLIGLGLGVPLAMADDGPLANATVSFGQWDPNDPGLLPAELPLDRFTADPGMGRGNNHELLPNVVKIKAGGSVNFIISGGHVVAVYDDGHQPEDINLINIEPIPVPITAGGVLSDSNRRIYRGTTFSGRRDGVEVVQFTKPGTYLVICARKNHFFNPNTQQFEMFGYVRVLPNKDEG